MSERGATAGEQVFRPPVVRSPWVIVLIAVNVAVSLLPAGLYVYYGIVESRLTYRVGPGGLTVEMGVGRVQIPAAEVAAVDRLADPGRVRRIMGAGLRGLQMGWYQMGDRRVYRLTTTGRDLVFVDTVADAARARPNTRYVLSPTDADRFVALLRAAQAGDWTAVAGDEAEAVFVPVASARVFTDPVMILAVALTLPLGLIFPWLLFSGPRGMHFRVGPDGVTVHHLGRKLYPWESIRSVERLDQPARFWRLFGASLPGYYVGSFTAGQLGTVRVYATRLKPPLALMETSTGRVVLGPEDVDAFLEAVRTFR